MKRVWTKAAIRKEAAKHTSRSAFWKHSGSAASAASKYGSKFYESACVHMPSKLGRVKVTDDELLADADQYSTKQDWVDGNNAWYHLCKRRSALLFGKATEHMTTPIMSMADVFFDAAKYGTKKEWREEGAKSYSAAHQGLRAGRWTKADYERMCSHMGPTKSNSEEPRCVYTAKLVVEEASYVYVGLTNSLRHRLSLHRNMWAKYSWLFSHADVKITATDYLSADEAAALEVREILKYRRSKKWTCVNISDGGTFGGAGKKKFKTVEEAVEFVKQFKSLSEMMADPEGRKCYTLLTSRGWWRDVSSQTAIVIGKTYKNFESKAEAVVFARLFKSRADMLKDEKGRLFYETMIGRGWLNEVCCKAGLSLTRKPNGFWTAEAILADARLHASLMDWTGTPSYKAAHRLGEAAAIRRQIIKERLTSDADA